ncbi:MAG: ABC transporter permease subunit [Verrucomicrobiota bacterium]
MLLSIAMLYAGFSGTISAPSAGRELFIVLSTLAGLYVVLDAALLSADCLSREKREGTLGLLFLTDLKGYDIVAGKLVSRASTAAYALMAALPMLGISLFLGGVTGWEFTLMMLALLNALFFSASFGLLASAVCRRERAALSWAVLGNVTWTILVPLGGWWISQVLSAPAVHPAFVAASPAGAFLSVLQSGPWRTRANYTFGHSFLLVQALGWLFLIAASVLLPYRWRDAAPGNRGPTAPRQSKPLMTSKKNTATLANRSFEEAVLAWAVLEKTPPPVTAWRWLPGLIVAWGIGLCFVRSRWLSLPTYVGAIVLLHAGLAFVALLQACRGPAQDQRNGTLEALLTTPLGEEFYRRGRLLATKRSCFWPLLAILATDGGLMVAGCLSSGSISWEWLGWITVCLVLVAKLLMDLYALAWVGFWQGLKLGNTGRAMRNTILYVFLAKWLLVVTTLAFLGVVTKGQVFQSAAGFAAAIGPYVLGLLVTLLYYAGLAMSELRDNLRPLAQGTQQNTARAGVGVRLQRTLRLLRQPA